MKLRENLAFGMFATSIMSWTIVVAITPVGGWCNVNPHSEDYKLAFVITSVVTLLCVINLLFNSKSSRNEK